MDNFIDRRGYRSHCFCGYTIKSLKIKTGLQTDLSLGSVLRKKAKNDHVHEGGKVGRRNATPIKTLSVNFYDPKTLSFIFGNDIFIIF